MQNANRALCAVRRKRTKTPCAKGAAMKDYHQYTFDGGKELSLEAVPHGAKCIPV